MRHIVECKTQFRVGCSGCILISDENGTCTACNCMDCNAATEHIRNLNFIDKENNIPSISRKFKNIEYLSNLDGTVGIVGSLHDAFDMFTLFDYKIVGYSAAIIKRYPLFALLKTGLMLPIPDKLWFGGDIAPLIVEYTDTNKVYMIASKIPRSMIE